MKFIRYEKADHLVTITMNKPDQLNALDAEMLSELREAWISYRHDDDAWLAIFTGTGRAFTVGADRSWFKAGLEGGDFLGPFIQAISQDPYWSGEIDKPVVAAVNGFALGGGFELVLKADLRIAAESAIFQIAEVQLGGILVLWDNLPFALASELMAGRRIKGRRAYEMGMVNEVVPDDKLMEAALAMAKELLAKPPLALHHSLKVLREMRKASVPTPRGLFGSSLINDYAIRLGKELIRTEDWKEANTPGKKNPTFKRR